LRRPIIATLILAVALLPVPYSLGPRTAAAATAPSYAWQPVGNQYVPRTDGHYVVWLDGRGRAEGTHTYYQVFGADLTTGEEFEISEGDQDRLYPDVDEGIAVWAERDFGCDNCQGDIAGKRLATGEEFVITATPSNETRPAITNDIVLWVEIQSAGETL